ncbi:MAG: hydantoinase/oxoprolinase family protein [Alphaproteobacteria bacterium]|nr:hydantoinase/oxoprolinase family protein [Alphaproteobacteria bacterium]
MQLIGVDVGGTFTDLVYTDSATGRTLIHKVPSTPDDPGRAVADGIGEICSLHGIAIGDLDRVLHGTTIATNAVLEYDGATAGMITTEGYRDILHIGRHQRPQHYSIRQEIPWQDRPLVRRRHRKTVAERLIPPKGEVLVPLDEQAVREAARELRHAGVESVAICFLFSYLNPAHELRAKEIVAEEFPEAFLCTSAEIAPQFREFERFTTAALNAFVGPKVAAYIANLERKLKASGAAADLRIMGSNGGVATPAMVAERPVTTLLSGPAAGVLGGAWCGGLSGHRNLITFDIGGTSADIGIVTEGQFGEATARDTWIAGYPALVPMIDIHTIGAGGGSIAHVDAGGAFKVGPESAGARPGPAAYGHGGAEATVTDAHVTLGRLVPDNFLGGRMRLDADAAAAAVDGFATKVGMSREEAALGILTILNANMANAIRSRTVQKGLDPRDYALVAFGGAGPLHGADVAAMLDIPTVIIPPHPGITSAVGLLTTDLRYDAVATAFQTSDALDIPRLNRLFQGLEDDLAGRFAADGIARDAVRFERAGDLRYAGQGYELRVAFPPGGLDAAAMAGVLEAFGAAHEAEYGHRFEASAVEIVNVRITAAAAMEKIAAPAVVDPVESHPIGTRPCAFGQAGGGVEWLETPLWQRTDLPLDRPVAGPAIVLQEDTTTVVPPGATVTADRAGNLILRLGS